MSINLNLHNAVGLEVNASRISTPNGGKIVHTIIVRMSDKSEVEVSIFPSDDYEEDGVPVKLTAS